MLSSSRNTYILLRAKNLVALTTLSPSLYYQHSDFTKLYGLTHS